LENENMAKQKLTFDEAFERINDERYVDASDVQARALSRILWVSEWHLPGCMSESRGYSITKKDAIENCLSMAEGADGPPRGMLTDLRTYGRSDRTTPDAWARGAISTITRVTLRDIL
jgi:hypothetical protein